MKLADILKQSGDEVIQGYASIFFMFKDTLEKAGVRNPDHACAILAAAVILKLQSD